jgi:hypothetical protein
VIEHAHHILGNSFSIKLCANLNQPKILLVIISAAYGILIISRDNILK